MHHCCPCTASQRRRQTHHRRLAVDMIAHAVPGFTHDTTLMRVSTTPSSTDPSKKFTQRPHHCRFILRSRGAGSSETGPILWADPGITQSKIMIRSPISSLMVCEFLLRALLEPSRLQSLVASTNHRWEPR